jgi:mono/diheme cytochrome c family protein
MVLKHLILFFGIFLFVSCSNHERGFEKRNNKNSSLEIDAAEAKIVYSMQCASCHGENGKLKFADAADLSVSKLPLDEVKQMIETGNDKGMIPYTDILSPGEIKGVSKFVLTLRK